MSQAGRWYRRAGGLALVAMASSRLTLPLAAEDLPKAALPEIHQDDLRMVPVRLATGFSYDLVGAGRTLATFGNGGDPVYAPAGLRLPGALSVAATSTGEGGLGVAASITLNQDQGFPASLAPFTSGYPSVSFGTYSELDSINSVTLYLENQSGDLATIWPARYDARHVFLVSGANGGRGSVRVGLNAKASPPYSEPSFYDTLSPAITKAFVPGQTMIDSDTVPRCRGRITGWDERSITVDRWVEVGKADTPCGKAGDPQALRQVAGVGIAFVGPRNAIWLQNGNLYLDNIETTTRAITDELAVYNRTGHYVEHGYDARFPGGLFPQADGPFIAGALRFSSGTPLNGGSTENGYQGTVAYASAGDWEYGFWSRSARRAHFLVAPSEANHVGAVGLLDTEPVGKSVEVRPGNQHDTFSIDRASGDVTAAGMVRSGMAALAQIPACNADRLGAHFYVADGRKPGERRGDGSGVPVDCSPPSRLAQPAWLSVYDHLVVTN